MHVVNRDRAQEIIGDAGGVNKLSLQSLKEVCRLLFVSDIGTEILLRGNINSKLTGVATPHPSARLMPTSVVDALGKR